MRKKVLVVACGIGVIAGAWELLRLLEIKAPVVAPPSSRTGPAASASTAATAHSDSATARDEGERTVAHYGAGGTTGDQATTGKTPVAPAGGASPKRVVTAAQIDELFAKDDLCGLLRLTIGSGVELPRSHMLSVLARFRNGIPMGAGDPADAALMTMARAGFAKNADEALAILGAVRSEPTDLMRAEILGDLLAGGQFHKGDAVSAERLLAELHARYPDNALTGLLLLELRTRAGASLAAQRPLLLESLRAARFETFAEPEARILTEHGFENGMSFTLAADLAVNTPVIDYVALARMIKDYNDQHDDSEVAEASVRLARVMLARPQSYRFKMPHVFWSPLEMTIATKWIGAPAWRKLHPNTPLPDDLSETYHTFTPDALYEESVAAADEAKASPPDACRRERFDRFVREEKAQYEALRASGK